MKAPPPLSILLHGCPNQCASTCAPNVTAFPTPPTRPSTAAIPCSCHPHPSRRLLGPSFPSDSIGDGPPKRRSSRLASDPSFIPQELTDPSATRRTTRSHAQALQGPLLLPQHTELHLTLDSQQEALYQEFRKIQDENVAEIWLHNEIIETFPIHFSTPVQEGFEDYFRTCATGYCSMFALAQLHYVQHHPEPNTSPPDLSEFSAANIDFVRGQLASLSAFIEAEDSPISAGTQTLWAKLHQDGPPEVLLSSYAQEYWMFDSDFITLASHLKLSFSLWQEPYEGPGFTVPSSTAHLAYIFRNGRMRHPSIPSTPFLQLASFPRSLSLGPIHSSLLHMYKHHSYPASMHTR